MSVSLNVNGTNFSFVSAHLPAHQGRVAERNSAYRRIMDLMPVALKQGAKSMHTGTQSDGFLFLISVTTIDICTNCDTIEDLNEIDSDLFREGNDAVSRLTGGSRISNSLNSHRQSTSFVKGYKKLGHMWRKSHSAIHQSSRSMFDQVNFDVRPKIHIIDINNVSFLSSMQRGETSIEEDEDDINIANTCTGPIFYENPSQINTDTGVTDSSISDRVLDTNRVGTNSASRSQSDRSSEATTAICHDRYFFFGDLNYRSYKL